MFTTPLQLEASRPGHWLLIKDLIWRSDTERIVVPAGTSTDLASIPRPLRGILNQNGNSRRPAVLHDYLYQTQSLPRAAADEIFRRALAADGMGAVERFAYWAGVRLGGWLAWRNKAP
jgi:hypothetical protein